MNNFENTIKCNEDITFFWKAEENPHKCSITTYWITWDKAIIIATSLGNKQNQKIRNITKEIINFINKKYKLSSDKIMLIEHCPEDSISNKEMYRHVLLTSYGFIRYLIDKKEIISLINQ